MSRCTTTHPLHAKFTDKIYDNATEPCWQPERFFWWPEACYALMVLVYTVEEIRELFAVRGR